MNPVPDHGEKSYKGSGRLAGRKALITGGDSGMGHAAHAGQEAGENTFTQQYIMPLILPGF